MGRASERSSLNQDSPGGDALGRHTLSDTSFPRPSPVEIQDRTLSQLVAIVLALPHRTHEYWEHRLSSFIIVRLIDTIAKGSKHHIGD
jgi:hypothetical protein